jgi:hypothetical protein
LYGLQVSSTLPSSVPPPPSPAQAQAAGAGAMGGVVEVGGNVTTSPLMGERHHLYRADKVSSLCQCKQRDFVEI